MKEVIFEPSVDLNNYNKMGKRTVHQTTQIRFHGKQVKNHAVEKEIQSPLCFTWENRLCIIVGDIYERVLSGVYLLKKRKKD